MSQLHLLRLMLGLAVRADRRVAATAAALSLASQLMMPASALATAATVDAIVAGASGRAAVLGVLTACSWSAGFVLKHHAWTYYYDLADLTTHAFEHEVIQLTNGSEGIAHLERADFSDRLEALRQDGGHVWWAYPTVVSIVGIVLQLAFTLTLLALVEPLLFVLPLFALPWALAERWSQRHVERARLATAQRARRARHLLELMTTASAGKELRIYGLQRELRRRQREAWAEVGGRLASAEWQAAGARVLGQLAFGLAAGAALFVVARQAIDGQREVGELMLLIMLTTGIAQQVNESLVVASDVQRILSAGRRYQWLREAVRPIGTRARRPVPERIGRGIAFERVDFRYPGSDALVLEGVDVRIPAGAVVAVVGENGAGKTTLAKLLCRFYEPTAGRITLDGQPLGDFDVRAWRARIAAGFQDFCRFELRVRETVGVGELTAMDDPRTLATALERGGADEVVAGLADGLESQLGRSYADGVELSGGQWQRLALSRAMMREQPLLLLLDEPSSALDAHAEHALFERYAAGARRASERTGGITVFTSHRFSTVRMADLIVVLDGCTVAEQGSHDELVARGGIYAELYALQATAYSDAPRA